MITYYEMIDFLEKMKFSPKDENKLVFLKNHTIYAPGNSLYRYIDHLDDLIRTRLNNCIDNFIAKIKTVSKDENLFSLEIIEIKKEVEYVYKITDNINIPDDNKNNLKESINNFSNEIEEILEEYAADSDTNGKLLSILKSHNVNKREV